MPFNREDMDQGIYNPEGVNFIPRTYDDIFLLFITEGYNSGLLSDDKDILTHLKDNHDIENMMVMDYSILALILSYVYEDMDRIWKDMDIQTCSDESIEKKFGLFITRTPPSQAVGEVIFTREDKLIPQDITIPMNTKVLTNDLPPLYFATTEDKILPENEKTVTAPVICLTTGVKGNIHSKQIVALETSISGIKEVTNTSRFSGGHDKETLDHYRMRGYRWRYSLHMGTPDAIEGAIRETGITRDFRILPLSDGAGTCRIILDPPTTPVLDKVTLAVNNVKANDEDIIIKGVEPLHVTVNIGLTIDLGYMEHITEEEKLQIITKTEQAIRNFIDGGIDFGGNVVEGLKIGKPLYMSRLVGYVLSQIPRIADITVNSPIIIQTVGAEQRINLNDTKIEILNEDNGK